MGVKFKQSKDHNLAKDWARAIDLPIYDMVTKLAHQEFLHGKDLTITSYGRNYHPSQPYTYAFVANQLKVTEDVVARCFFNRPSKLISEHEFMYHRELLKGSPNNFNGLSPHFWLPDSRGVSCAVDLRSSDFSKEELSQIKTWIGQEYGERFFVFVHDIGNGAHIHIQDLIMWNKVKDQFEPILKNIYTGTIPTPTHKSAMAVANMPYQKSAALHSVEVAAAMAEYDMEEYEALGSSEKTTLANVIKDTRTILPSDIQNDGLMEVLRIGDINFSICPVTQVSYSQSMQYVRFSTLRTVGDPKIATDTVPNNITLNIIFPDAESINSKLSALIAQFMVTPFTIVQNRFIARTIKPLVIDHQGNIEENELNKGGAENESVWMVMTDLNIRSVPDFPEAYEAYITLEPFEDRVFGSKLHFLKDKDDLIEKYRKKKTLYGEQFILPSETTLNTLSDVYRPSRINVTPDPNQSNLYKTMYKSVQDKLGLYQSGVYNGKLVVVYNNQTISRETMRKSIKRMDEAYNKSLIETARILNEDVDKYQDFLSGKGINVITGKDIKYVASLALEGTTQMLSMAVRETEFAKSYKQFRYSVMDPIARFKGIKSNAKVYVDQISSDLKLTPEIRATVERVFETAINQLGSIQSYTDGLGSIGVTNYDGQKLRDIVGNVPVDNKPGQIGDLETLLGKSIFNINDIHLNNDLVINDKIQLDAASKRAFNIQEALKRLTRLCLFNVTEKEPIDTTDDGLPSFPNMYQRVELFDGINSFATGISFSISNKIVPQQVIGWKEMTYQHLGRSDWTINMNVIVTGDEPIRQIMYIMNKTGMLSKVIQSTSPSKFINLDTTVHILEGDPIFQSLGIEKVVLNSVEISSVPGKPNMYQMSISMEQADLLMRDRESITESQGKNLNNLAQQAIALKILPAMKSLVIRKERTDYGKFLDFMRIQEVVERPVMRPFWVAYGLLSEGDIQYYDYMDRYNFYKLIRNQNKVQDPIKNWDLLLRDIFPIAGEGNNSDPTTYLSKVSNPQFKKAIVDLEELIKLEKVGQLVYTKGKLLTPDNLISSLEFYYESIGHLVNSFINFSIQASTAFERDTTVSGLLRNRLTQAGGGVLAVGAVALLLGTPVGWGMIVTSLVLGAVVAGVDYARNNIDKGIFDARKLVPDIIPSAFNISVNQKLTDIVKEMVSDDNSLRIFAPEFQIGVDATTGKPKYLQDEIRDLRKVVASSLRGCYVDFEEQINIISTMSGIDARHLDPAFYLYAEDIITTDLIRESRSEVLDQLSLLVTRANISALQLGTSLEEKYKLNKVNDLSSIDIPITSSVINADDIRWVIDAKRRIVDVQKQVFENPIKQNLEKAQLIQKDSPEARDVFFSKYWDQRIIDVRTEAFMETAFARLTLVNSALRFDAVKASMDAAVKKIQSDLGEVLNNHKDDKSIEAYTEYKTLFVAKEFKPQSGDAITWYDAILLYGCIDNPYEPENCVNHWFKDLHKCDMQTYFKNPYVADMLQNIDVIARCKKATNNESSARMMAQYNALEADPRMLEKRLDQIQSITDMMYRAARLDKTGNPIRLFPTFKIYFIEEDAPEWGIYNDFYDYSAVQEITVVKDRKSASDTCVIKLSNVAGKLTDTFADNLPEFGTQNFPLTSIMLKAGMSILVKMGYSNSEVELPVVFYGIITEVAPGPVVEVICQGYGAELNEVIAPNEGYHHGIFGTVKSHGDVATWALQRATGLNHFGKIGYDSFQTKDTLRLSGDSTSGLAGRSKFLSFITGLPGISINDPRDDNVFLPYSLANINTPELAGYSFSLALEYIANKFNAPGNINFDWYIRDQSIWDVLKELSYFSPDFIVSVLPYNDNVFPFIPKIRNTIYVGPRRGYYKYTDMYSLVSKDVENINIPEADELSNLLMAMVPHVKEIDSPGALTLLALGANEGQGAVTIISSIVNTNEGKSLVQFLQSHQILRKAIEVLFSVPLQVTDLVGKQPSDLEPSSVYQIAQRFAYRFTNYPTERDKDKPVYSNRGSLKTTLQKLITQEIGLSGLYYNIYGNNHQYKKVQQCFLATSYTNILSNNITATANGWANRVRLTMPPDPTTYKSREEVPIDDRAEFISLDFNLDDDILDDQIRTKEVFMNNIDPSMWDDSFWAKDVMNGTKGYMTARRDKYLSMDQGKPKIKSVQEDYIKDDDIKGADGRQAWEQLPSRWRVGISLLAEEARDMYNGELVLIGDSLIKPYDVIHIFDYTNEMSGPIEVGRVIHTLSAQTGFTTRIKPDLIVNQKNKFNEEELFVGGQMMEHSFSRGFQEGLLGGIGLAAGGGALMSLITAASAQATTAGLATTALAGLTALSYVGVAGAAIYGGYKLAKYHHERIIMVMNNIIGRDSIDILPLTYRKVPYVAGVEGIKKDSYMRHMYGMALDDKKKLNVFERIGYMNGPMEFEFYTKVAGDSAVWGAIQNSIFNPGSQGQDGLYDFSKAIKDGITLGGK